MRTDMDFRPFNQSCQWRVASCEKCGTPSPRRRAPVAAASQLATRNPQRFCAFTLVEMLVTCGLTAVLMLAVTQIFSIASKTMGGGQALGAAVRDAQAAQAVLYRDLSAALSGNIGPCFIIQSGATRAYRNKNDEAADTTVGTFDFDGDGTEDTIPASTYNFRNHRVDTLGFFAMDRYARQTGDGTTLVLEDASREAWIWYGHLNLANDAGLASNATRPGAALATNPNNYYATQWALGRAAILLKDPASIAGTAYLARNAGIPMTPICFNAGGPNTALMDHTYDLAGTTVTQFRNDINTVGATWWNNMCFEDGTTLVGRFRANRFQTRPLNALRVAQQIPIFLPACTQFMVEFAGDFVTQDAGTGAVVPDPDLDGNVDNNGDGTIDYVATTRQVRWYGLPRDTTGDGAINALSGDVTPVRDTAGAQLSFERGTLASTTNYVTAPGTYTAAWGPSQTNRPKMIRITLVIDRPEAEGKLLDGQSFEYVFNVGY